MGTLGLTRYINAYIKTTKGEKSFLFVSFELNLEKLFVLFRCCCRLVDNREQGSRVVFFLSIRQEVSKWIEAE
jgi:hypothetical protein